MRTQVKSIIVVFALAISACSGSDPAEMARERGAIELLTSWPCGASHYREIAGGDLKTDWTAKRDGEGGYRVTLRRGGEVDTWTVRVAERAVTPDTAGAKESWMKCRQASARTPAPAPQQ